MCSYPSHVDVQIVKQLIEMLDKYNVHAKSFRMVRDIYKHQPFDDMKFIVIADRSKKRSNL